MDKIKKQTKASLIADREVSLKMAVEAELRAKEMQASAEQQLEEGYEEAYEMIAELRDKINKQDREITRLLNVIAELNKAKTESDHGLIQTPYGLARHF